MTTADEYKKNVKPKVGVSQCLLGDAVRYDGKSKPNQIVIQKLGNLFELVPVCPEVEAGLSTPRPPVQLTGNIENPRLTGRDDSTIDVTQVLQDYCQHRPAELGILDGFIFKSHSPSCGLNSTPVFIDGLCITESSRGIFAKSLCMLYPDMAVIEDQELEDMGLLDKFIQSVITLHSS